MPDAYNAAEPAAATLAADRQQENRSSTMRNLRPFVVTSLALALGSCTSIPRPAAGSPRVEAELVVQVQDAVAQSLDGVDDEFRRLVEAIVLPAADVNMRLYPVLSHDYASGHTRPPYLMTVRVNDLDLAFAERTITEQDGSKRIERFVDKMTCTVATSFEKRRDDAPPLLVGWSSGSSVVRPGATEGLAAAETHMSRAESESEPIPVARDDVLDAIESALKRSLRELVPALDRELAQT